MPRHVNSIRVRKHTLAGETGGLYVDHRIQVLVLALLPGCQGAQEEKVPGKQQEQQQQPQQQ